MDSNASEPGVSGSGTDCWPFRALYPALRAGSGSGERFSSRLDSRQRLRRYIVPSLLVIDEVATPNFRRSKLVTSLSW